MSYTDGIFYLDYENGNDAARTALTSCVASNPSGSVTRINKTGHGLVTGAIVDLTLFTAWLNAAWKITKVDDDNFDLDGAVWQATAAPTGTVTPRGGSSWADAWKTMTSGATAARIQPGDTIRIAKSPALYGMGQATWTVGSRSIVLQPLTSCSFGDSGATKVRVTKNGHNLMNGGVVLVSGTDGGTYDGRYKITVIDENNFDLDGTTYSADKSGSVTPAYTCSIDDCDVLWTAGGAGDATVTLLANTVAREGTGALSVAMDASPQTNVLQAYHEISELNLALYDSITFQLFLNETITANQWKVCLCSDTAGATVVDTFEIPALIKGNGWIPMKIAKSGGGQLGASIKSIAIYSGSSAPAASKYIRLDNFSACLAAGFSLRTAFSKNSAEQGGADPFLLAAGIEDATITLDGDPTVVMSGSNKGPDYAGTTETVNIYCREMIFAEPASATSVVHETAEAGSSSAVTTFSGGWNTSTSLRDGDTFFASLNGNGTCIKISKEYITLLGVSFFRFYVGLDLAEDRFDIDVSNANHCRTGITMTGSNTDTYTITNVRNVCCGDQHGLGLLGARYNTFIGDLGNFWGTHYYQIQLSYGSGSIGKINFISGSLYTSTNMGIWVIEEIVNTPYLSPAAASGDVRVFKIGKVTGTVNFAGLNDIQCTIRRLIGTVTGTPSPQGDGYGAIDDYNETGFMKRWLSYGNWETMLNDRVGGTGNKLVFTRTHATYGGVINKRDVVLARVACAASKLVTFDVYAAKSVATMGGQIVVRGGQIGGVDDEQTVSIDASDTDWHKVTITFTPTTKGVVEIMGRVWCTTDIGSISFADISITQAT
jgi:hypothetical protein